VVEAPETHRLFPPLELIVIFIFALFLALLLLGFIVFVFRFSLGSALFIPLISIVCNVMMASINDKVSPLECWREISSELTSQSSLFASSYNPRETGRHRHHSLLSLVSWLVVWTS